jgi:hypothetical protein
LLILLFSQYMSRRIFDHMIDPPTGARITNAAAFCKLEITPAGAASLRPVCMIMTSIL